MNALKKSQKLEEKKTVDPKVLVNTGPNNDYPSPASSPVLRPTLPMLPPNLRHLNTPIVEEIIVEEALSPMLSPMLAPMDPSLSTNMEATFEEFLDLKEDNNGGKKYENEGKPSSTPSNLQINLQSKKLNDLSDLKDWGLNEKDIFKMEEGMDDFVEECELQTLIEELLLSEGASTGE